MRSVSKVIANTIVKFGHGLYVVLRKRRDNHCHYIEESVPAIVLTASRIEGGVFFSGGGRHFLIFLRDLSVSVGPS